MQGKKILPGLLLFGGAFPLLFWNEGNAVRTAKGLEEGAGQVITVPADQVQLENNARLVHVTGLAKSEDIITEPLIGFNRKALKLERTVEMYQWVERREEKKNDAGNTETTYRYEQRWSHEEINSRNFQNRNQYYNPRMPFRSETFLAKNVSLGAFKLAPDQVNKISGYDRLMIDDELLRNFRQRFRMARRSGDYIYSSNSISNPRVGDVRVMYQVYNNQDASVIAMQSGNSFRPFETSQGTKISLVQSGKVGHQEMFDRAQAANTAMTWAIRLAGLLMMFSGLKMMLSIIPDFFRNIPILGSIVQAGTSLFAGVTAFLLAVITIAVSWFFVRPVLSILLLATGLAGVLFARNFASKKDESAASAT